MSTKLCLTLSAFLLVFLSLHLPPFLSSCPSTSLRVSPPLCLPTCQPVPLTAVYSSFLSAYLSTGPPPAVHSSCTSACLLTISPACHPLQLLVCLPVNMSPYLPSTPAPCLPTCKHVPLPVVYSSSMSAYL
jgi:hypothetical protein